MEKLELKYLAVYGNGIKFMHHNDIWTLTGLDYELKYVRGTMFNNKLRNFGIELIKPILRPLSDLTKEIEHNGEKFIPIVVIHQLRYKSFLAKSKIPKVENIEFNGFDIDLKLSENKYSAATHWRFNILDLKNTPYWIIQQLHEWHFDTDNLIGKKLAIDINTI